MHGGDQLGARFRAIAVLVISGMAVTSATACSVDTSKPSQSELMRATEAFFVASASLWDGWTDEETANDVEEMSILLQMSESNLDRVQTTFRQWSDLLDQGNTPLLLLESRDRFADLIADYQEQEDIVRKCIEDWPNSIEMVALCSLRSSELRQSEWDRNHRSAYDTWERWRASDTWERWRASSN